MKLFILLLLCAIQVLECNSFNFGSLFRSSASKSSPSVQESANKGEDNEHILENATLSSNEDQLQGLDTSSSLINGTSEKVALINTIETLIIDNSTEKILNNSEATVKMFESSLKHEKLSSSSPISELVTSESSTQSSILLNSSLSSSKNISFSTDEPEEVVLGTKPPTFTVVRKTIYEKTIEWVGDTYTLSILVPIAAGILFAVTIILTVATCRCIRKKCRRRRFRKRVLPDTIKNLRPSDQARLLGDCCDSSDEF